LKNIILTGAGGQLGKALKKELSGDFEILTFGKSELDISNFVVVEKICAEIRPDFILNAAAMTAVDRAENERKLAMKINSEAVGNLAKICKKIDARLIHFSTDYVFDGENENGFSENDTPNPINFYGESKLAGEREIQESNCDFAIVRTSWLFGEGENFVRTMLKLASEKTEIKVVSDQIGSPTFTVDLAKTTREILEKDLNGVFHATNSGATSWANFARKIFEIKNLPTKVIDISTSEFPTVARRPRVSILRNSKLLEMRGWEVALQDFLQTKNIV